MRTAAITSRGGFARDVSVVRSRPAPPGPLNLWMNISVQLHGPGGDVQSADRGVSFEAPAGNSDGYAVLKALRHSLWSYLHVHGKL